MPLPAPQNNHSPCRAGGLLSVKPSSARRPGLSDPDAAGQLGLPALMFSRCARWLQAPGRDEAGEHPRRYKKKKKSLARKHNCFTEQTNGLLARELECPSLCSAPRWRFRGGLPHSRWGPSYTALTPPLEPANYKICERAPRGFLAKSRDHEIDAGRAWGGNARNRCEPTSGWAAAGVEEESGEA